MNLLKSFFASDNPNLGHSGPWDFAKAIAVAAIGAAISAAISNLSSLHVSPLWVAFIGLVLKDIQARLMASDSPKQDTTP